MRSTINQSSNLNTLPSLGTHRRSGIHKRSVRHPLPHAVPAIKTLEEQPLVVIHAGPVVKLLRRAVSHRGRLARPVRIPMLDGDQVGVVDRVGRREP